MNCPVCKTVTLEAAELPTGGAIGLSARRCNSCGGQFVAGQTYLMWVEQQKSNLPEKLPEHATELPVKDSRKAKLCPECGHYMTRAKVGHGVSFELERCAACGGIWFDANEWENLRDRNLHDDVHYIFSSAWQAKVLRERQELMHEELMIAKLGKADWAEIQRIKAWLDRHPHRPELLAILANVEAEERE